MNLAFNSIILILLLLPGFIFSLALYNSDEPFVYTPLTQRSIIGLFVSIIFLLFWPPIFEYLFNCPINYSKILEIVAGKDNDQLLQSITSNNLMYFGLYIITANVFGYLIGMIFHYTVKKFKLDAIFSVLRFESPWYYLLNGYNWEGGEADLIVITATVEIAGNCYLYNGYLETYHLDEDGELDCLILTETRRRNIDNDHVPEKHGNKTQESTDDRFYPIDGHNFVIKYADIKNLNIQFIKIDSVITDSCLV